MIVHYLIAALFLTQYVQVDGCGKDPEPVQPSPPPSPPPRPRPRPNNGQNNGGSNSGDQLAKLLGGDTKSGPYDNGYYTDQAGGPVAEGADLDCDFEGDCCWVDVPEPEDQIDWALVSGKPDSTKWKSLFGSDQLPQGNFLATGASKQSSSQQARFASCTVECADEGEGIKVTLNHWSSPGIQLLVCLQDTFTEQPSTVPLTDCVPLDPGPGPTTVDLPGGQLLDIVLLAEGYDSGSENVAAVDNIIVDFQPCGGGGGPCDAACSFEGGDPCVWVDSKANGIEITQVDEAFEVHEGKLNNPVTGIRQASDGTSYIACYLYQGEVCGLEAQVSVVEDVVLCFDHYEATSELMLEVLLDGSSVFSTDPGAMANARQWFNSCILIPQGTSTISFKATNTGDNQGAAGLDNFTLLQPEGSDPNNANKPVC